MSNSDRRGGILYFFLTIVRAKIAFRSAAFAADEMFMAHQVFTINHPFRRSFTPLTAADSGVLLGRIVVNDNSAVENVERAFEFFAWMLFKIANHAAVELVDIFETFFEKIARSFFAAHAASANSNHSFAF